MRKIYTSIFTILLVGSVSAQVSNQNGPVKRSNDRNEYVKPVKKTPSENKAVPIWESSFGTPSDWVVDHDAADCTLDWQIGINSCTGGFPTADIESTTANDGWALLDSDAYNQATPGEDSWLTMANPVDLTAYPNVIVEFETHYRAFNNERCYLVVGVGDGLGNVVWPNLDQTTDVTGMPNVFPLFDNIGVNESTDNPFVKQVNISAIAGGEQEIYIRFNWTGSYGYAWFVDDFKIIEQPLDDVQMLSAWVAGENNEGTEYGRYIDTQMDANWYVGAEILNFGVNDQTNVIMTADFTSWNSVANSASILAGNSELMENLESPALNVGLYEGVYTVVSDNETAGTEFYNNTQNRNFEITGGVYSQDGIDVHPAADLTLSSIGTDSFTGAEDALVLAAWYHIKSPLNVEAIQIQLANGTEVGGELFVSIIDTADFFVGNLVPVSGAQSQIVTITQTDINNGFKKVYFSSVVTLNPGCYYAAVELYSNAGASHIRILDDLTVAQPFWSSAIFIPQDQSYTNGEALGIRLMEENVGLEEVTLQGVSVYPNPSEGVITVTNDKGSSNLVEIFNVTGQLVYKVEVNAALTIDLGENGSGVYLVKVSNENGSMVERVVIK